MLWGRYASNAREARYPHLWAGRVFGVCPSVQGPAGLNVYDLSGRGNRLTLQNVDVSTAWNRSNGLVSVLLDGSNDYASTATTVGTALGAVTGFTTSGWVNLASVSPNQGVMSISNLASNQGQLSLLTASGTTYLRINNAGYSKSDSGGFSANSWTHFAITYNGATVGAYFNGKKNAALSGAYTSTVDFSGLPLHLGVYFSTSFVANMRFDDVAAYNRGLTEGEIRLLATRRGIAYEARRNIVFGLSGFSAYWARRQNQIIGGGV